LKKLILCSALAALLAGCVQDTRHKVIVSTADQRMVVLEDGVKIAEYPVSTSKFGLGDRPGSNATPLGELKVRKKIGEDAPPGAVFKSRKPTGEVLAVDAPGRDPIVTRILWLDGQESGNRNAFDRHIYIHGTPEERNIGIPASYGCIRMKSKDVIELYSKLGVGARVYIVQKSFQPAPPPAAAAPLAR